MREGYQVLLGCFFFGCVMLCSQCHLRDIVNLSLIHMTLEVSLFLASSPWCRTFPYSMSHQVVSNIEHKTKLNQLQSSFTLFNCARLTLDNSTNYWSDVLSGCVMCVTSTSDWLLLLYFSPVFTVKVSWSENRKHGRNSKDIYIL